MFMGIRVRVEKFSWSSAQKQKLPEQAPCFSLIVYCGITIIIGMEEKGLSVIITTYNRQAILARTLEALSGQTQLDFQIIIVDDGSTDGTSQWLKKK